MKTYADIQGWFDYQAIYDRMVAEASTGDVFVEIGCWLGQSTVYLADAICRSGKAITLYAVDNFSGVTLPSGAAMPQSCEGRNLLDEFNANLQECGVSGLVRVIVGDSAESAKLFRPQSVAFAFIDADHSYEAVQRDIAAWRGRIKPGGVLAGHDRQRASVNRAVTEAFGRYEISGPEAWWVRL
jgi:predicted O-methyltransferase YrrM